MPGIRSTANRSALCATSRKRTRQGNPIGGTIGPDLRKIGNKVNQRWLAAFLKNPHGFQPNTKMPGYNFTDKASGRSGAIHDGRVG